MDSTKQEVTPIYYAAKKVNKRSLGKMMIKYCGNEGTDNNEEKASLRRQIQSVISYLDKEYEYVWKDVEIKIYAKDGEKYVIHAGGKRHKFIVLRDSFTILNVGRPLLPRIYNWGSLGGNCIADVLKRGFNYLIPANTDPEKHLSLEEAPCTDIKDFDGKSTV